MGSCISATALLYTFSLSQLPANATTLESSNDRYNTYELRHLRKNDTVVQKVVVFERHVLILLIVYARSAYDSYFPTGQCRQGQHGLRVNHDIASVSYSSVGVDTVLVTTLLQSYMSFHLLLLNLSGLLTSKNTTSIYKANGLLETANMQ